jgi:hypothetical protein
MCWLLGLAALAAVLPIQEASAQPVGPVPAPASPQLTSRAPAPPRGSAPPAPVELLKDAADAGDKLGGAAETLDALNEEHLARERAKKREAQLATKPGTAAKDAARADSKAAKQSQRLYRESTKQVLGAGAKAGDAAGLVGDALTAHEIAGKLSSDDEAKRWDGVEQAIIETEKKALCAFGRAVTASEAGCAVGEAAVELGDRIRNAPVFPSGKSIAEYNAERLATGETQRDYARERAGDLHIDFDSAIDAHVEQQARARVRAQRAENETAAKAAREAELRSLRERASLPPEIDPGPSAWETLAPALLGTALQLGTGASGSRGSGSTGSGHAPASKSDAERTRQPCIRACECGRSRGPGTAVC